MPKRINLLLHIFVVSLVLVYDMPVTLTMLSTPEGLATYVVSRIFSLTVFYTCYFWLVPLFLAERQILIFFLFLLALVNIVTIIGYLFLHKVHLAVTGTTGHLNYSWAMHFSGMFAMTVAGIFGTAFRTITGWFSEMQKKSTLEQEKLRNELLLLKAQVNPHFLFNTLNNIDFLIYSDQAKASESLIKLSLLLRYVIYDTVNDLVPLQKEIEQIEAYIDLQRLRYRGIAKVSFEKTGDPSGKMVAPMLFMPFVENAFKYTDEAEIQKGLNIYFYIYEKKLEFTCNNSISPKKDAHNGGFGLDNVRKRLDLQYPDNYELSINHTGQAFSVALKLNLQ